MLNERKQVSTPVVHALGVQLTLLRRFRVCRRRDSPALAARKLEVEPLLVVPSLVRCLQSNGCRDDVDGPVAHNEPLFFDSGVMTKPKHSGHNAAVGLSAGAPQWRNPQHSGHNAAARVTAVALQWRNTGSRPRDIGAVEGSLKWRDPPLVHGSVRHSFAFGALVKVASKDDSAQLHAQVADE